MPIPYADKLSFPIYLEYEISRLVPSIKLFLIVGMIMLLGFSALDIQAQPEISTKILVIRFFTIVPLIVLFILTLNKSLQKYIPLLIGPLGLVTLLIYIYLHTQVAGKIYYVAIAWTYFLLVIITIASFYSKLLLIIHIVFGGILSYFILILFLPEEGVYIAKLFQRSLGVFLFTIILALKTRKNAYDNYKYAKLINKKTYFDYLTQLYNRRGFSVWMEQLFRIQKDKCNYSLIMLDIDDFKKVNDIFGHQAGDYVIVSTANIIKKQVDWSDENCVVRFGGEEFLILIPDKTIDEAIELAETIRNEIEIHVYDFSSDSINVTASFGVTKCEDKSHTLEYLLSTADKNLYKAKHNGKNQVVWK